MTTEIVEYSKTEAALSDLAQRYKGVLFDVTTREGLSAAIKGRVELRGYRVALEKTRVEIKAPALKRTQLIDSEARRITAEIEALVERAEGRPLMFAPLKGGSGRATTEWQGESP